MGVINKLATKCQKCKCKTTCDHKFMMSCAYVDQYETNIKKELEKNLREQLTKNILKGV